MALFTIDPSDGADLYADVVAGGSPSSGDDIEITKGFNDYTAGLTFTANNWGNVLVGQQFRGTIGAAGSPWTLQANTSGKMVKLLGGRRVYLSTGASTIARLAVELADPNAVVVIAGAASGALTDAFIHAGQVELLDSIATLGTVRVGPGGRPKIRGSGSASAMTALIVNAGGQADIERDAGALTVEGGGVLRVRDDRVAVANDVTVNGVLEVYEMGDISGDLIVNEGGVLDLSNAKSDLTTDDIVLGDAVKIIQRHGGPGYTVSSNTTTRGRGARVEYVTR